TVLAESRPEIPLPPLHDEVWREIEVMLASPAPAVASVGSRNLEWTAVVVTNRPGDSMVLMLQGDWTPSAPTLRRVARNIRLAKRSVTLSGSANIGLAAHRLSRTLAAVTGVREVCQAVLRHMVRAVPSRLAAFAVPGYGDERLSILATEGYPLALVEHLRID